MNVPLIDLKQQYQSLKPEIDQAVLEVLAKGNFILGQQVAEFEEAFAKYCGTKYCVGVASGSDALLLGLDALGVGPGDEVITVANTFISTVFPIMALGARPVLVDIDPRTYQIDPQNIEKAINSKTKVIIPVHLFGIPAQMDKIIQIAKKHQLYILEDACQAHGSRFKGRRCGSFGDLAAFSFYPGKNLGAAGDGGALTTNNRKLAQKLKAMRDVGQTKKYRHDLFGYNSRLDTIHAAVLSVKLRRLDSWNANRREIAKLYNQQLADLPVTLPQLLEECESNYHVYVIRTTKRDRLLQYLRENGVFGGIHYPLPVHLQKSTKKLNYPKGSFPISEKFAGEILSLPIFPELKKAEVVGIAKLIRSFFQQTNEK